jgi:hypothetical protein
MKPPVGSFPKPSGPNDAATKTHGGNAEGVQTSGASVTVSGSAPPTTGQVLTAIDGTTADWQTIDLTHSAESLETTGTAVTISGAAPPTAGQVLTAIDTTTAEWQTPVSTGGGASASGIDTIRIGTSNSHASQTPLVIGQFQLNPSDYHSLSTFSLRAVAANGSTPLTSHVRLYNVTDAEQVAVLDFVDTLTPGLQVLSIPTGTVSGTIREASTIYEAQVFVDSPAGAEDTIELGSAEIRVQAPLLCSGIDTIRLDMSKSYSSSTALVAGQFELNTEDYPSLSGFTLRAIAANGTTPLTSHVVLYNVTDSETVATLDFIDTVNPQLKQQNLVSGTASGTLKPASKIYEARIYVDSPVSEDDTIELGSAEIRVHYN